MIILTTRDSQVSALDVTVDDFQCFIERVDIPDIQPQDDDVLSTIYRSFYPRLPALADSQFAFVFVLFSGSGVRDGPLLQRLLHETKLRLCGLQGYDLANVVMACFRSGTSTLLKDLEGLHDALRDAALENASSMPIKPRLRVFLAAPTLFDLTEVQTMALADEVAADIPAMDTAELTRCVVACARCHLVHEPFLRPVFQAIREKREELSPNDVLACCWAISAMGFYTPKFRRSLGFMLPAMAHVKAWRIPASKLRDLLPALNELGYWQRLPGSLQRAVWRIAGEDLRRGVPTPPSAMEGASPEERRRAMEEALPWKSGWKLPSIQPGLLRRKHGQESRMVSRSQEIQSLEVDPWQDGVFFWVGGGPGGGGRGSGGDAASDSRGEFRQVSPAALAVGRGGGPELRLPRACFQVLKAKHEASRLLSLVLMMLTGLCHPQPSLFVLLIGALKFWPPRCLCDWSAAVIAVMEALTEEQRSALAMFREVTANARDEVASMQLLQSCGWNVEQALSLHWASHDDDAPPAAASSVTAPLSAPLLGGGGRSAAATHGSVQAVPTNDGPSTGFGFMSWIARGIKAIGASVFGLLYNFIFGGGGGHLGGPASGDAFRRALQNSYGGQLALPQFHEGSFSQAISSARQQLKFFQENFVVWGGDVARMEAHQVAQMIRVRQFPSFCVLLPASVEEIRVIGALHGQIEVDAAFGLLTACMEDSALVS
eukprot:s1545_g8.t1